MSHASDSSDHGPTTDYYDIKEEVTKLGVDAYLMGFETGFGIGRQAERKYILRLATQASTENEIGRLVYLSDLEDYIRIEDEATSKPEN